MDRRTRPQRWRDAVAELLALQAEYGRLARRLARQPPHSATAEALHAIVELDLDVLADIEPLWTRLMRNEVGNFQSALLGKFARH